MIKKFKFKKLFPLILIFISLVLFFINYKSGTYLVGWDNLFPELNFAKAFKVNLQGIWQWYRGLGGEDGLAHAATLPHTIFLYLLSFIFPQNLLRYIFQILMHLLGGLGMYYLILDYKKSKSLSFIGAIFYQFNLATIQMFYTPLEVFSVHFAALPWLLQLILKLYEIPTRRNFLLFFLVSFITTIQGFVPTVFIAYLFAYFSLMIISYLKLGKSSVKISVIIAAIIFTTNAFWMLPFAHSAVTQGNVIKNTKINQLSSQSIYERNKKRGGVLDMLYLKGFMLDTYEDNLEKNQELIMKEWNNHINNPFIFLILNLMALLFIIGLITTVAKSYKQKTFTIEVYFLPLLLVSILMLGSKIPILSFFSGKLRDVFPLFGEAFRFPITKFFIVYSFTYSVFLVAGLEQIINKKNNHRYLILSTLTLLIIVYTIPSFRGYFFFDPLRLKIPNEYFQTINYFKEENKSGRIMTLPQATFWNWMFYSWGARGSGFLWYGIEQPMLERPFDPWNNYNEQYFNEVFYALQTENVKTFKNIISKYNISFILIDGYRTAESKIQQKNKLDYFIKKVFPEAQHSKFGEISVYKLSLKPTAEIQTDNIKQASPFYYEFKDYLFEKYGNYLTTKNWNYAYLFNTLFTNKTQEDIEFTLEEIGDYFEIKSKQGVEIEENSNSFFFHADPYPSEELLIPVKINITSGSVIVNPIKIKISINNFEKELSPFDPIEIKYANSVQSAIQEVRLNGSPVNTTDEVGFALAYTNLENLIYFQSANNSIQTKEFKLNLNRNDLEFPLNITGSKINYYLRHPILRPPNWNINNALERKNYLVEAPCSDDKQNGYSLYEESPTGLNLTAQASATCLHQYFENIVQNIGVYFHINAKMLSGSPLYFVVDNPQQNTNVIDTKLHPNTSKNIIIVPPTSPYLYDDYGTHFRNSSSGNEIVKNKISWINVGYLPYSWIKSFRIQKNNTEQPTQSYSYSLDSEMKAKFLISSDLHFSPHLKQESYLYLPQSYNSGWLAYTIKSDPLKLKMFIRKALPFIYGQRLKEHTLVNNWANGWTLRPDLVGATESQGAPDQNIVIIFWPQYLQYVGFILLIGSFIFIARFKRKG